MTFFLESAITCSRPRTLAAECYYRMRVDRWMVPVFFGDAIGLIAKPYDFRLLPDAWAGRSPMTSRRNGVSRSSFRASASIRRHTGDGLRISLFCSRHTRESMGIPKFPTQT